MKSYAKVNIFLKITGKRENFHTLNSRFILLENLYDEIEFIDGNFENFTIISSKKIDGVNILNRVYDEICIAGFDNELSEFFRKKAVKLTKNIPMGGGLGGGSSNAATMLKMLNNELNLKISNENLAKIATKIGSDVSFFLSELKSANVGGTGEVIEEFDDEIPPLTIHTKDLHCNTALVYKEFRNSFFDEIDLKLSDKLSTLKSVEILNSYKNHELNDLLKPCQKLYPELKIEESEFLSGSGSTIFEVKR